MSQVVIGDILPYTQAVASGSQTVFGTNWTANVESDVVVYSRADGVDADDATQQLSYPADFSVAFIGAEEEVQVTLVTPSTLYDIVTITRQTPADRVNLYSNTNFVPSMLNNDFGILTLVDQQAQLVDQKIGPRYNYSAVIIDVVDTILPILGANQVWAKDGNDTAIIAVELTPSGSITGTINVGIQNQLAYYAANGMTLSGLSLSQGLAITAGTLIVGQTENIQFNDLKGIQDSNGNSLLVFGLSANAVNYFEIINAGTGSSPNLVAVGSDTNIIMKLSGKGTGGVTIEGTATNDNSVAGYVGEYAVSSIAGASAVSLTDNTAANLTSISLTAGDWDVYGNLVFNIGGTCTNIKGWISSTSATAPAAEFTSTIQAAVSIGASPQGFVVPPQRFSLASTTTVYISGFSLFSTSTVSIYGRIWARRVR